MKKCGDCIHADVCEHNPNIPLFNRANAAYCKAFKDRTKYVEVVLCMDCKYWCDGFCDNPYGMDIGVLEDEFCSYGERRNYE